MASDKTEGTQIALSRKSRGMSMVPGLRGTKQWELAMRKFNMVNKIICKSVPKEIPRLLHSKRIFPTGSIHEGTWNELGICGTGTYEFPVNNQGQRKTYFGKFENGQFHGDGQISYPDGTVIEGKWNKGELLDNTLTFADGLQYTGKNWLYCLYPDRRYTVEYDNGLLPAGASNITSTSPAKPIPFGYYDTGDGMFDPRLDKVCQYDDTNRLVRAVSKREREWIMENCRTNPDDPLGPCPFLYEKFLEPKLESEYPPPPAARTKNYVEEIQEIEAWAKQLLQARRTSFNPLSKAGRFSYHRRTTVHSGRESAGSYHGSRHASASSRHASRAMSGAEGPRKLMFDAGTMDKDQRPAYDRELRHRSTFCERTRSLFRERSLQHTTDSDLIHKIDFELTRSASDLHRKTSKTSKHEKSETTQSIFQRPDDDDMDAFETPQRHPNW